MYIEIFQQLGLSKNEAKIFEELVSEGELSVGEISKKSQIHRRNIYDSLNRLIEKGLVFEILERRENRYQAVSPVKLMEYIEEKRELLSGVLPELEKLYREVPRKQKVCIYRGIEGWKNYMRDIVRVGEDFYCIGGKGAWMDERLHTFFPGFIRDAKRKKINYYYLFDSEVEKANLEIVRYIGHNYRFLPAGYSTQACIDVFGSHVNILSDLYVGRIGPNFSLTVIIDEQIAAAYRTWFRFIWDFCKPPRTQKKAIKTSEGDSEQ